MRWARVLRTTSFRLTLLYTGVFSGSVLVLFGIIYWNTAGYVAGQLDAAIDDEVASLRDEAQTAGSGGLPGIIAGRMDTSRRGAFVYLLQDPSGRLLAGNLAQQPAPVGSFEIAIPNRTEGGEGEPHRVRARGVRLPNGDTLVVGRDAEQLDELQELIARAFGWSFAATIVLGVAGGAILSAGPLRRIEAISRTSRGIMAGDLSRRVPTHGTGDEFDHLADSLNAMLSRIEALMDGLRQVSNDIAHDLRTPLTRLRQRLELTRRKATTRTELEAALDRSLGDVDAILETFAALLRIAQVEATHQRGRFGVVDLSEVLHTVVEVYQPLAEARSQRLAAVIPSGLQVRGDRELLTQMMANLIENAVRHAPPSGELGIEAWRTTQGTDVLVWDTGPGVPADERDKVFRRFYRLETSRSTPGSGLGLSLVAAVAKLHGATITLDDNRPGLRISLRFPPPARADPATTGPATDRSSPRDGGDHRAPG